MRKTRFFMQMDKSHLILLVIPIILMLWVYYGKQANFIGLAGWIEGSWGQDACSAIYEYSAAFLLMFVVPALIVKVAFKSSLRAFGFRVGDARWGLRLVAIALPVLLLAAYVGSLDPAVREEYPLAKGMIGHVSTFLIVEAFYLIYYLGWEFLFRGFMLFGLEKYGALAAILMQTIPSTIVHIGKPASESFAAIAAGLVFGYLAVRTRSIFYPLILHAAVGIGTDVFVALRLWGL
ncbi:MAG: CPBP family intramembrane metalloprotease [Anaerolineae bacterium]|nr:CPBP family intramembrane metalloprotease [Anaerolineae bacterium]